MPTLTLELHGGRKAGYGWTFKLSGKPVMRSARPYKTFTVMKRNLVKAIQRIQADAFDCLDYTKKD